MIDGKHRWRAGDERVTCKGSAELELGNIVPGVFTPVLAKHSKSFSLIDCISVGVDRMQRNFEPMRKQVEAWQKSELTDVTAKVAIYEAFVEGKLEAPKHLARTVHDLYFEPKYDEFRSRTIWSLSNAFTSAFKELDPIPQFKATAKLGEFLDARFSGVVLACRAVLSTGVPFPTRGPPFRREPGVGLREAQETSIGPDTTNEHIAAQTLLVHLSNDFLKNTRRNPESHPRETS